MLRGLLPRFKPLLQQIRLLQVAWILTFDWIKLHRSQAVQGSYLSYCKKEQHHYSTHFAEVLQNKMHVLATRFIVPLGRR